MLPPPVHILVQILKQAPPRFRERIRRRVYRERSRAAYRRHIGESSPRTRRIPFGNAAAYVVTARRAAGREVVMSRRGKQAGERRATTTRSLFAPLPVLASRSAGKKESERAHARRVRSLLALPHRRRARCTCGLRRRSPIPFSSSSTE